MIPALVLTAGLATRLRPLSLVRAKAALPVAGEPLVQRILRWLAGAGVREAVLNLHHLPHTLTGLVGDGTELGLRVRYSWEVPILGSAGGPRRALPLLGASRFLIVNGDVLTDADPAPVVARHEASGAMVTLLLTHNTRPDRYGGVQLDGNGVVTGFMRRGDRAPSYHFTGIQVAEAAAFASVPADTACESTRELYPALIANRPGSVRGIVADCTWHDIGTTTDFLATTTALAARGDGWLVGARCTIDPSAIVDGSSLWDNVRVEPGATLSRCVVTDGVRVPAGTSWHDATLRQADGELCEGERRVGELAVGVIA